MGLHRAFWVATLLLASHGAAAQGLHPTPEIRRYAIEVAGVRVGTMTATRTPQTATTDAVQTLTSDVQVNFLVYRLVVYYQVVNRTRNGQLLLSTVQAHTNQGDFSSRTEWQNDHYTIVADQYKHHYRATETTPITSTVTDLFFAEPRGRTRAFAEYFGDYFALTPAAAGHYRARRADREDEYQYANGQLVLLIKKNPLKNFVIRLLP